MSQVAIREYDAKRLWANVSGTTYQGVLVETLEQIEQIVVVLETIIPGGVRVVKPDQLFGKRGKYGLVGVKLSAVHVQERLRTHREKEQTIGGTTGILDTFLIEPFVPHEGERYVSLNTEREGDVIRFSASGGIDIEENRSSVLEIKIGVLEELGEEHLAEFDITEHINVFIMQFFQFFRAYGFVSLEVNPFVIAADGTVQCLDMVAKIDNCESRKQPLRKQYITRVKPFGTHLHLSESVVETLDEKTGASLKLTLMNPQGRLWFLLGGGGASVLVIDAMSKRGLLDEVANYGELSGNPDEESNGAYVTTLIETMLSNGKTGQYLCLVGGIANFTDIVALVNPLCRVLKKYAPVLVERNITLLMRRGGLRVEQAMSLLQKTCEEWGIKCVIQDDDHYLTKVFDEVRL